MTPDATAGWLFLQADHVPEQWRLRARAAAFVPLTAGELTELLGGVPPQPELTDDEEALARLIARGSSVSAISRQLRVSSRTVERRLALLRRRLGVGSSVDLALALAQRGFAVAAAPPGGVGGPHADAANLVGHPQEGGGSA
jgi:DNA-binding NarL/FixJ family response regulator